MGSHLLSERFPRAKRDESAGGDKRILYIYDYKPASNVRPPPPPVEYLIISIKLSASLSSGGRWSFAEA